MPFAENEERQRGDDACRRQKQPLPPGHRFACGGGLPLGPESQIIMPSAGTSIHKHSTASEVTAVYGDGFLDSAVGGEAAADDERQPGHDAIALGGVEHADCRQHDGQLLQTAEAFLEKAAADEDAHQRVEIVGQRGVDDVARVDSNDVAAPV